MKIVKVVVLVLLALAFLAAGFMKVMTPYAEIIANPDMAWASDFSDMQIKIIGVLELLGGLGLVLPLLLKKFKKLVPLSALGLSCVMVGAIVTHSGRGEPVIINIVILVLALLTFYWHKDWVKNTA